jgi:hypothetical protein
MYSTIQSKAILVQTIRILSSRHRETYLNESIIDGDRDVARKARQALDTYGYALNVIGGAN